METQPDVNLTYRRIFKTWWPLAASWLLMGLELPALSAVVARLPDPEINLAAYGGVVFPLALIIESPIIMLLAASTALSKDYRSYRLVRSYMMWAGAILTLLHALVVTTPLYDFVVKGLIAAPPEIVEPSRIGLVIMLPWTWAIAYRRFNQGMLIRLGHSNVVSIGTAMRLAANFLVLVTGYILGSFTGIIVATSAVAVGVTVEAIYVGIRSQPVLRNELIYEPPVQPPLSYKAFFAFYIPLALTSLLSLVIQPIGSAAISRMPQAIDSLAVWPVVTGIIFLMRGMGIAFNEVVVSLLDAPDAYKKLNTFTWILVISTTVIILVMNITPLATLWFKRISALSPSLTELAKNGLWIAVLLPGLSALQSWYQGAILNLGNTRGITEAVSVFIVSIGIVLGIGVSLSTISGIYIALVGFVIGTIVQTCWLWYRSQPVLRIIKTRGTLNPGKHL